jgi:hypothetical protein
MKTRQLTVKLGKQHKRPFGVSVEGMIMPKQQPSSVKRHENDLIENEQNDN